MTTTRDNRWGGPTLSTRCNDVGSQARVEPVSFLLNALTPHFLASHPAIDGALRVKWGVSYQRERGLGLRRATPCSGPHHHGIGDDHQDRGNGNGDEPTDPVDSRTPVATERRVDVPADEDTDDATHNGEPDRDVVPCARSNKLPKQANNDACNDHSDDLHTSS